MPESVLQYEVAAGERLLDAMAIALADGREASRGSVYLWGYVVEMILKAAYFRVLGWNPTVPVKLSAVAKTMGLKTVSARDGHDLSLLSRALMRERGLRGLETPGEIASDFDRRVARVSAAWSVDDRYDGSPTSSGLIGQMFEDASWFVAHRLVLAQ